MFRGYNYPTVIQEYKTKGRKKTQVSSDNE